MKSSFLILMLVFVNAYASAQATSTSDLIEGCQGDGCGCTREEKTSESFTLFEKMDPQSKVIGKFGKGTTAKAGKAFTKILSRGKATVYSSDDPESGLKVGDELTTIFYIGEGFSRAKRGDETVEFDDQKVKLKVIEKPKYETWYEIEAGKQRGYVQNRFPFLGCLE